MNTPTFPETIDGVRAFINTIPTQTNKLRFVLGLDNYPNAPRLAQEIIGNCIDTENNEWEQHKLMEVGLNAFTSTDLRKHIDEPGPNGEKLLKSIYYYHVRLRANAHLKNVRFCPGDPDANRFGNTRFTTDDETKDMLESSFKWALNAEKPEDGFCPTFLIGHAIQNDTNGRHGLEHTLGFDAYTTGTVVATIDTQTMACELGIRNPRPLAHIGNPIGLGDPCAHFQIPYRNAHTAGNDAAYTIIAAIFMALYGNTPPSFPKTVEQSIDEVEVLSRQTGTTDIGIPRYCSKCHGTNHFRRHCRAQLQPCYRCQSYRTEEQVKKRQIFHHTAGAKAHLPEDCTWRQR